jgi:hypothetical protein
MRGGNNMAFWDKEDDLITIVKNKAEKTKFSYCEKGNKKYINLTFLKDKKSDGEYSPRGGTSFGIDKWDSVKTAIDAKLKTISVEQCLEGE